MSYLKDGRLPPSYPYPIRSEVAQVEASYANRPTKCRNYTCILRRQVSNGLTRIAWAHGLVDDLKILIHYMESIPQEITGSSFHKMNFRDF